MIIKTPEERAALLLRSLPSEMAEAVLARLGPQRSAAVRARMQDLEQQPQAEEALDEALSDLDELLRIAARGESGGASAEAPAATASRRSSANGTGADKEQEGSESGG